MSVSRRSVLTLGLQAAALVVASRARGGECRATLDSREPFEANGISALDLAKLDGEVTPAGDFFVRSHFGAPLVREARLSISGRVARPLTLSLADLRRLPPREALVTLECAGNSPAQGQGLVSTARWKGCALETVLERAGGAAAGDELVLTGADAPGAGMEPYARAMKVSEAREAGALLVWEMNGAPLSQEHGGPLRLVVPGWYAMASVKWLASIDVRAEPFEGRYQRDWYVNRVKRPDGSVVIEPVTRLAVKSLVARVEARGDAVRLRGAAWGGEGGVSRVEVTTDAGRTWRPAVLEGKRVPGAWRLWRHDWKDAPAGSHVVASRAYDGRGGAQPLARPKELAEARYAWNEVFARRLTIAC
jgi:DMSO/TMAO reductase YedYZ molybdopterin-dependent catalytic subunit